jgi:hypothetical protein
MDFIEKIFGFSPDGGDGSFELLLFTIPVAGLIYLAYRRHQKKAKARRASAGDAGPGAR